MSISKALIVCAAAVVAASAQNFASYSSQAITRTSFLRSQWNGGNLLHDTSLALYYPLAAAADQAYDASGHSLTGTYQGSVSGLTGSGNHVFDMGCPYCGKMGSTAPYFNHSHPNYISTPAFSVTPGSFTISAWVMPGAGVGQYARIIESNNTYAAGYYLGLDTTGTKFYMLVNSASLSTCATSPNTISKATESWYLVTGTYDGANANLYVNGSLVKGPCAFSAPSLPSQTTRIGCGIASCSSTSGGWDGQIQDVRIYNRTLSAGEIAALYAAQNH